MTKKETIVNDIKFRKKCFMYGLNYEYLDLYRDIIILDTPKKDVFVLFDENYNVIGIPVGNKSDIREYAILSAFLYEHVYTNPDLTLPYPFQKYSLKNITDLARRISINETNQGHSFNVTFDGKDVSDIYNAFCVELFVYIKFLGNRIEEYFRNLYHMRMIGLGYPDVKKYLKALVKNITECVDSYIKDGNRPFPINVIEYFGQGDGELGKYEDELYSIINLMLRERGLKARGSNVEASDEPIIDTLELANEFLLSPHDFESKYQKKEFKGRQFVKGSKKEQ